MRVTGCPICIAAGIGHGGTGGEPDVVVCANVIDERFQGGDPRRSSDVAWMTDEHEVAGGGIGGVELVDPELRDVSRSADAAGIGEVGGIVQRPLPGQFQQRVIPVGGDRPSGTAGPRRRMSYPSRNPQHGSTGVFRQLSGRMALASRAAWFRLLR